MTEIKGYTGQRYQWTDAVNSYSKLRYQNTSSDDDTVKSFAGTRETFGVGMFCFSGEGQINGQPPTEYTTKNGYTAEVTRTFDLFA